MDLSQQIAENARMLRHRQRLSQRQVAERGGIHRSVLSVIESGTRRITWEDTLALCRGLDCGLLDLLDGTEPGDLEVLRLPAKRR